MLNRAYEEVDHFHLKCIGYILERTMLKEELERLLEQISQKTWDAAVKVAQA